MARPDELSTRLTDLSRLLVDEESLDSTLDRVANLSTAIVDACDGCGISLVEGEEVETRHASNDRADRVDEIQYSTSQGPCLDAIRFGHAVRVASFEHEQRWPQFIGRALDEGIAASYSVPLQLGDETVGSLNLYSTDGPFSDTDEQLADLLATQAAVALRNAQTFDRVLGLVDQLSEALSSRDAIGQAKGILMTQHGIDADRAFDLLRRVSQHRNEKLRDVAQQISEGNLDVGTVLED